MPIFHSRRLKAGLALGCALLLVAPSARAISWESVVQFIKTMQSESSAWAVTTKQTAVSANQAAESFKASQQQLATAMGAIAMSDRVRAAVASVDSTVGQPVSLKCAAQAAASTQVAAWEQSSRDRTKLMATFAGNRVATRAHGERERLALHRDSYCTVGEAKSGMCELKANGMQGWDSNYGGAFGERTLAAEGELAGYAYAAMVADHRAPAALDCRSKACAAAAADQLALSAAGTMVADAFVGQVLERRVPMLTGN